MIHCIEHSNFQISLKIKVFDSDIQYPINTILSVAIFSDGFSANTDMNIDIKEFISFTDSLIKLYETLDNSAIIQEKYNGQQFIKFVGNKTGHIHISGQLNSNGRNGFDQKLSFENCIDQTYISEFIDTLSVFCEQYR